ncbi:soluble lamin-associated protein of 75 kDa isoform X1 [Colossoma macropomum]|uniref:soluble lamin-associated protein of 75 kDa isoform X1 n=1 Tax=Colossoma macropomum TaxID=42526 RepID=UPI001863E0A5|nr:soluble lamin-associated protein of 75 kDa isoform X1 [Colossoma macropomum]
MEFPVDVLVSVSHEELERSAHSYMSELLYSDPEHGQYFTLTTGRKIRISLSNVGFVPLYGANLKHKVLALFAPEDQFTAVALFLDDQWYAVDDILRTADPAREGLIKVRSVAERIVLYVLNRIIYRTNEMSAGEVPFLCHGENDYTKILWKSGEAVGFYSVKPRGSLCNNFVSQCYLLPVMDSIFVRKSHRGNEHGLQMLEDYVDSFKDDELGLKYPLSPAMSRVCRHYLNRYPADVDLLWEVEGVGGPYQKTRVASKLSTHALRDGLLSWGKDDGKNRQTVADKVEMTEETSLDITEEIIVVNKHLKVAEETHDTPISTRTRSSEHKRKKRMREEKEMSAAESQPEKICRVEEPETEAVAQEAEGEKSGEEVAESAPEPAVGTEDQVAPEAPTVEQEPKEQVVEVNGELTEEQVVELNEEEAQGSIEAEAVLQNGTVGEEEEEMDVDEAAEKQDPIDTVDSLEDAAVDEPKDVDEENPEGEVDTVANEHQEEDSPVAEEQEVSPAAEEEGLAEDKLPEEAPQVAVAEEKEEKEVDHSAEEKQEVACEAEENLEVSPEAEEKQEVACEAEEKLEVAPEAEEKQEVAGEAEEKQEVACEAEEKLEVAPEAEEKQEVAPDAEEKQEVAPEAEEKQEVAPDTEEKLEAPPETEEKLKAPPEVEEKLEASSEAEEKLEAPPEAEEKQEAVGKAEEKLEAPPEAEEKQEAVCKAEEKQEAISTAEEKQEVSPVNENKQQIAPVDEDVNEPELAPTEESSEEATDAPSEGQQGQEEPMEMEESPVEQEGVQEASTEPPKEEESQPEAEKEDENMDRLELEEEEEEEVQKKEQGGGEENTVAMAEDECRGEGEDKSSDESPESSAPVVRILRGGRTKAVPPTPKRSSKRLTRKEDKVTTEEGKMTIDEENVLTEEERVTTEEEKVTTEEEVEHSSEGEEPREEPPVIDRRVLRQKIKVISIEGTAEPFQRHSTC